MGHLDLRLTTSPPRRVGPGSCSWRARLSYARGEGAEDTDKVRAPAPRPTPCCHSRATAGAAQGSAGLPAAGLPRRCADALARAWRSGHADRPNAARTGPSRPSTISLGRSKPSDCPSLPTPVAVNPAICPPPAPPLQLTHPNSGAQNAGSELIVQPSWLAWRPEHIPLRADRPAGGQQSGGRGTNWPRCATCFSGRSSYHRGGAILASRSTHRPGAPPTA